MPKVFIVDDDVDLLEGQRAFLESRGYAVETAGSTEEGLEKIGDFKPDIVLADLMMEHYDSGFVFCKKVRDLPGLENVPIVMQTAAPREIGFTFDASDEAGAKWMKVDEVLTKPVPLEHLAGLIEGYLSGR